MKPEQKDWRINRSLFSLKAYLIFFLLIAFVVSCCFLLFLSLMEFDHTNIRRSAVLTFINVLFLSFMCVIIDGIRRKVLIERPVKRILKATHQLTRGDLSARIETLHSPQHMNEFDAIIEDFNKMAEELSGIETLRTDFIANVSHELKTPLAVIQNYATMLDAEHLPEEQRREYAKAVTQATRRLSNLVMNILSLNKLEHQQIFPQAARYNLGEQLRECLLGFEDQWERKGIQIDADIDDLLFQADGELLSLVWNNLISNAIKFTEPGGTVTVSLKEDNGDAVVRVADTGCGMNPEAGRRIFEKFYQADPSHAVQGNGLGLALVKRVVDILGSDISVESAVGDGSTFTVRLRRSGDEAD